jgi:hypothetical protein
MRRERGEKCVASCGGGPAAYLVPRLSISCGPTSSKAVRWHPVPERPLSKLKHGTPAEGAGQSIHCGTGGIIVDI